MIKKNLRSKICSTVLFLFLFLGQLAIAHEGTPDQRSPEGPPEKQVVLGKNESATEGGLLAFVTNAQSFVSEFKKRMAHLKSGGVAVIDENNMVARYLGQSQKTFPKLLASLLHILGVFFAAFVMEILFNRFIAGFRKRIIEVTPTKLVEQIRNISFNAILDFFGICVFVVSSFTFFYIILDVTNARVVLFFVFLLGIVLYKACLLISRSILSPGLPELRLPPLKGTTAIYLQRYVALISGSIIFLSLTCELIRVAGVSELLYLKFFTIAITLIAIELTFMILQKRDEFTTFLSSQFPGNGLLSRIIPYWSYFAIFSVCMLWLGGGLDRVIFGSTGGKGVLSLLVVTVFFLSIWILDVLFNSFFYLLKRYGTLPGKSTLAQEPKDDDQETGSTQKSLETLKDIGTKEKGLKMALKLVFASLFFTFVLKLWNINIDFGYAIAMAMFKVLIVICVFYVLWELISAAIQRRMSLEMPDEEEEMEEGGAGGSRIGTLLLLLRKFIFFSMIIMGTLVILSSIGINIAPLLAGVGVLGLAISFGAQSLVKDIISGLFFIMDDAFRVGDYIIIGSQKGTVEKITLRSLVLRHPRGKVDTIGFGNINTVSNLSRDYTITKLEFRVRYDTDIEKLRKIVKKKVYKPILANEELGPKLLGKIGSQGVKHMDDSAMIARVKYKTLPGDQFAIRKEIYRLMQQAFQEEGIEFAHKNVTVYIPDSKEEPEAGGNTPNKEEFVKKVAGAAALSLEQDELEALKEKEGK